MPTRFAFYISSFTDPFIVSGLAWFLVINSLDITFTTKLAWFGVVVFVGGLPPFLVLVYEKRAGKIKDWFMTERLERRDVHLAWIFGSTLLGLIFWFLGAPRVVLALSLSMVLISLTITITNLFWKISAHMVGLSFLIFVVLLVYSPVWLWLAFLLPLVAWARVKLGHHTLTQVTVGTIVTILITYFSFSLFGLATF